MKIKNKRWHKKRYLENKNRNNWYKELTHKILKDGVIQNIEFSSYKSSVEGTLIKRLLLCVKNSLLQ